MRGSRICPCTTKQRSPRPRWEARWSLQARSNLGYTSGIGHFPENCSLRHIKPLNKNHASLLKNIVKPYFVYHGSCGQTNTECVLVRFETVKLLLKTLRTFQKPLVQSLQSPRHIQRHVLDFTHSHFLTSVGTSDCTGSRLPKPDLMWGQAGLPHPNDDNPTYALVITFAPVFSQNTVNINSDELRIYAVTKY